MHDRCYRAEHKSYINYGGRGISVDYEWHRKNPSGCKNFLDWYEKNYKSGLLIDRIDNDGNYGPDNCRFATREEQMANSRLVRKRL